MHTTYKGNHWRSVDIGIDPRVENETRRWHVYLDGTYMWTKHTVTRYTENGIRSGSITELVTVEHRP